MEQEKFIQILQNLKDGSDVDRYLEEAKISFQNSCNKSAIILSWSSLMFFLYKKIEEYGISPFCSKCSTIGVKIEGTLKSKFDLNRIKDRDLIQACRKLGFYDSNVESQLISLLTLRNSCAHVSQIHTTNYQLADYIEQIDHYSNYFKNLRIEEVHKDFLDSLKSKDESEVIRIIKNENFNVIKSNFIKALNKIKLISLWEEYKEKKYLYEFIVLSIKGRKDDEKVVLFSQLFDDISNIPFFYSMEFEFAKIVKYSEITSYIIQTKSLDRLINIFINSTSFENAGANAEILHNFNKNFSINQILLIARACMNNCQIYNSYKARSPLTNLLRPFKDDLPPEMILELKEKDFNLE